MARVLLGVTGGIAAYKALEFVRLATKAGHAVRVVQTPTAQRFVGAASFAALTGAPVLTDEFERDPARGAFADQRPPDHEPLSHLELVANADVLLIAPASANTIAKLAHGLADNLLTSAALAATCPVLVAPAMNNHMYEHAATRANLATLRERGVVVIDPGVGALGSKGEWGVGRLAEPPDLLRAVEAVLPGAAPTSSACASSSPRAGRASRSTRCASSATAAPAGWASRSPRRPPRSARPSPSSPPTSASSAARASATSTSRPPPSSRPRARPSSPRPTSCSWPRAVADYRPAEAAETKLKKDRSETLTLTLERTDDIISALAAAPPPGPDARRLRRRARRGRGRLRPRQADPQGPRRRRRERHRPEGHRLRGRRERGDHRHRIGRAPRAADVEGGRRPRSAGYGHRSAHDAPRNGIVSALHPSPSTEWPASKIPTASPRPSSRPPWRCRGASPTR